MIRVKVPATSANMGSGFDCLGVALGLYNIIEITKTDGGLKIIDFNSPAPKNENNLIWRAMKQVFDKADYTPSGLLIVHKSNIPMTRGLGSSSACIVGGMMGANSLMGNPFLPREILDMAARMEGHPDNVTPALFGGMCVAVKDGEHTVFKSIKLSSKLKFAVMIPDFFVATRKSRGVLPESYKKEDAVFNISRAALMTAALASGDFGLLKTAAEDRMHQPYRKAYIDGMEEIFEKTYQFGAKATYLSGSGPTILSIIDSDCEDFSKNMAGFFEDNNHKLKCRILSVDNVGTVTQIID